MIFKLSTYFLLYSFLGWCIESAYKSIRNKQLINSGILFGPFCPIYGFGAIIMYVFLEEVSNKPIIAFLIGFVILSIWEYCVGVFLEKVFHTKYWDYSNYKFNLHGRVCLLNSIFWGILGVLFIDVLHPLVEELLNNINYEVILCIDIIAGAIFFIDTILSVKNTFNIANKLKNIEELNTSIKEKSKEIGNKNNSLQDTIDELKEKKNIIAQKSYKSVSRLKKSFPTLKSEQISNFLNDKSNLFKK